MPGYIDAASKLQTDSGTLDFGDIADDSILLRDGSSIIGGNRAWGIGNTSTVVAMLRNTTAATAGTTVQYSPILLLGGTAWDTDGPGPSRTEDFGLEVRPASGSTVTSTLHVMNRQDGGAWANSATLRADGRMTLSENLNAVNITSTGYFVSPTLATGVFLRVADLSTGLGTTAGIDYAVADNEVAIVHRGRTDGADNICIASVFDASAASITNSATMRLHSFAWTDDGNTYNEVASIRTDGAFHQTVKVSTSGTTARLVGSGANEGLKTVVQEETLTPSAVETNMSTAIPKGSVIRSVHGNAQSALTAGGTSVTWSVGTTGDPDKYGTAGWPTQADSLAKNSKSDWVAGALAQLTADETITLTAAATGGDADGNTAFSGGSVRIVVIYDTFGSLADAA